ncbi:MAG: hypothetical protein WC852_00815 [Candidatus Nanoarchaeia archaeon]|jgi:thymidylate kinase
MITRIIVEGSDCSGKSTVVDRVKNALHWDSKSLHHREGSQFARYLKEYATNENIVFDRSHFSEEVYSNLWRGGSPFSKPEKQILDGICSIDTLIIFTCPPAEVLKERYLKRGYEQQIRLEELEKSRELFCSEFNGIPHRLYLSKNYGELEELIREVKERVK